MNGTDSKSAIPPARCEILSGRSLLIAYAALVSVALVLNVLSLRGVVYRPVGDGTWYMQYMQRIASEGPSAFPSLFESWNADPNAWIFPTPSRVGFITTSALCARLFGTTVETFHGLCVASFAAWVVVNTWFARRRFGDTFALLLAALMAFSPLLLGMSRLVLSDSFTTLCLSVAVWSFLELVEAPSSARWLWIFCVSFAWVILVKELTILVAGPFAAFVLVERYLRGNPLPLRRFALALAVPPLCTLPIFVLAAGSPATLFETLRHVLTSPATNDYAMRLNSGPWYRYLIDYLCLSPWITVLALGAVGVVLVRARAATLPRACLYFTVLMIGLLFEHAFFIKNVRYLTILEMPLRILALWMLFEIAGRTRRATWIVACIVVVLCMLDWRTFVAFWVVGGLYDPVTPVLMRLRDMVPRKG